MKKTKELWEYFSNAVDYEEGGDWLPLSVRDMKGFPIGNIANDSRPEDVQPHSMFGSVYRVPKLVGRKRKNVERSGAKKHAAAANNHAQAAQPLKEADLAEDESDSDSSSSSSSDKRKKKERKNKRRANKYKEKAKQEKKRKLRAQARYRRWMKRYNAILPMITWMKAALEHHLRESIAGS